MALKIRREISGLLHLAPGLVKVVGQLFELGFFVIGDRQGSGTVARAGHRKGGKCTDTTFSKQYVTERVISHILRIAEDLRAVRREVLDQLPQTALR
jgi:hypothetical protein